jgi:hypothetical protein
MPSVPPKMSPGANKKTGPDALGTTENESGSAKYENGTDALGTAEKESGSTKHEIGTRRPRYCRKWPEITEGTIRDYKRWFVPRLINDRKIFTASLSVVYRLPFHFINNILTPKATLKTNMKINSIFYLRHLLSMDRQFCIPFIIISHMKHAYRVKNANLSSANLITRILRLHLRDIPQRDRVHPTNLFHELSNLRWLNNLIGEPPIWTPNHKYPINSWIKDLNTKVNQYTDPNSDEPFLEPEPTQKAGTSSQPSSYSTMSTFTFESDYKTSFDPYLAPLQTGSMQDYFGYIAQSMYQMNLNQ